MKFWKFTYMSKKPFCRVILLWQLFYSTGPWSKFRHLGSGQRHQYQNNSFVERLGFCLKGWCTLEQNWQHRFMFGHKSLMPSLCHALVLKVDKKYESPCCLGVACPKKNVPTKHRCGSATVLLWKILLVGLGTIN